MSEIPKSVSTYLQKANELSTIDPIISYFCKLYAVESILEQGLHQTNEEIMKIAMGLLDDVEAVKNSEGDLNDIISDRELSIQYVLSFSNNIFKNSLDQIKDHKTTKQTASSLLAFTKFVGLLDLWKDHETDEDVNKMTKYAKFHAARILKSLKKGEDPNDYEVPELKLENDLNDTENNNLELQDELQDIEKPEVDELGLPLPPTSLPSNQNDLEPSEIPKFIDEEPKFKLPSAPKTINTRSPSPSPLSSPLSSPQSKVHKQEKKLNIQEILESSEIYTKAQKHAKFAISAMNYEDKETAVKQLKEAIELLEQLQTE